jgi:small subunit ribosomal protein S21
VVPGIRKYASGCIGAVKGSRPTGQKRGLALAPAPSFFFNKDSRMTEVRLSDEDSLERALKLFKRKLQKSGLFGELRRRRHYVKPSEARAIKTAAALRRKRKKKVTGDTW